ncbi:MAG: methyltransferase domain-containing protein [Candidatus Obscuribacterales bacterium]|nr:methyltransferase domain-containing protein [Steroidobacteraceae bacterium]
MEKDKSLTEAGSHYDVIGPGYARTRREDPSLYSRIVSCLGSSQTVVNVGAGTGSYEPRDRKVLAVEPSEVMIRQRGENSAPVIKATAEKLPLHDKSFDAAMAVISIHHWYPHQLQGVKEMCRVARKRLVIVTCDPRVSGRMWLLSDYLPEVAELDNRIFPLPGAICDWTNSETQIEAVPISRDTPDWTLMSFWAHPERVLDAAARAATSGFSRQPKVVVERVIAEVHRDLKSGQWDEK